MSLKNMLMIKRGKASCMSSLAMTALADSSAV